MTCTSFASRYIDSTSFLIIVPSLSASLIHSLTHSPDNAEIWKLRNRRKGTGEDRVNLLEKGMNVKLNTKKYILFFLSFLFLSSLHFPPSRKPSKASQGKMAFLCGLLRHTSTLDGLDRMAELSSSFLTGFQGIMQGKKESHPDFTSLRTTCLGKREKTWREIYM